MHASSIIFFTLLTAIAASNDYANSYTIRNNINIEVSSPPNTFVTNDTTMIQLAMSDNEQQNTNKGSKTNTADAYDIDEVMEDVGYPIIGTIGGSMISLSLLPQVIKTYKTKSAEDFSYMYLSIYIIGTTLVNIYAIMSGLWPVYIPCLVELMLIIMITVMKFMYSNRKKDSKLTASSLTSENGGEEEELLAEYDNHIEDV